MKIKNLFFGVCLLCCFTACKPDFPLNAPYRDVPVVYGLLDQRDSIHYIKIYKGFQSEGNVFVDARIADSIYYYNDITVVLQEFSEGENYPVREIPFEITSDFPRDSGMFYYDKERIMYRNSTPAKLSADMEYQIKITNKKNGNVVTGSTPIVGDFRINRVQNSEFRMLSKAASIYFTPAPNASDYGYEIHVNFLYFEVDRKTGEVLKDDNGREVRRIVKNIGPGVGTKVDLKPNSSDYMRAFKPNFYESIAGELQSDPSVVRYPGTPSNTDLCIEIEGWAAAEDFVNFLLSNKPASSFVQLNNKFTNLTASDSLAFGFISSITQCQPQRCYTNQESIDSLVRGPITRHLGFRPGSEYKP